MANSVAAPETKSSEPSLDQWSLDEWLPRNTSFKFRNMNDRHSPSLADELFSDGQLQSQNSSVSSESSWFHSITDSSISGKTSSGSSIFSGTYQRNSDLGCRKKPSNCGPVGINGPSKSYLHGTYVPGWRIFMLAQAPPFAATSSAEYCCTKKTKSNQTKPYVPIPKKTGSTKVAKEQKGSLSRTSNWSFVSACKRCHGF